MGGPKGSLLIQCIFLLFCDLIISSALNNWILWLDSCILSACWQNSAQKYRSSGHILTSWNSAIFDKFVHWPDTFATCFHSKRIELYRALYIFWKGNFLKNSFLNKKSLELVKQEREQSESCDTENREITKVPIATVQISSFLWILRIEKIVQWLFWNKGIMPN